MPWDIEKEMASVGPDDFSIKEPVKEPELAKAEFNYQEPNKTETESAMRLIAPAVRLFATFVTLGFSEDIHKAIKKTLVATLSSFLTAEQISKEDRQAGLDEFKKDAHYSQATKLTVNVGEKAALDGMLIKPNTEVESQKYVILLNGLGEVYEAKLTEAGEYADQANANILIFNYRGTGDSTSAEPTRPKDLVADTMAMIEYLKKEKGVKPEDIVIHGYSLGGGVGAAAVMQSEGTRLINDRSFSTFSKATREMFAKFLQVKIGETAARVIADLAGALVKGYGLDLNTGKSYRTGLKDSLILHHPHDPSINKSSLKKHLDKHEITQENSSHKFIELDAKHVNDEDIHNTFVTEFGQTAARIKAFIHNETFVEKPATPVVTATTAENVNEAEFGFLNEASEETPLLNLNPRVAKPPLEKPVEESPDYTGILEKRLDELEMERKRQMEENQPPAEPSPLNDFIQELEAYEKFQQEFGNKPPEDVVKRNKNQPPANP